MAADAGCLSAGAQDFAIIALSMLNGKGCAHMETAERIARITEMEEAFDKAAVAILGFGQDLDDFEEAQDAIEKLAHYYGSEEWFADRDADEAGELPADLSRGVLGEDLPYDLLVDYRDLAIRMLKVATRALEE